MAKQKPHDASIATRHWKQGDVSGMWAANANGTVQDRIAGKDISARVLAASPRNEERARSMRPTGGLAREVSRGTRPVHRAKEVGKNWGGWGK